VNSSTVSDAGIIDDQTAFADLLHNLGPLVPGIEDYIRQQAQTHGLNISSQLSAGMRFIDARVMRESDGSWRSLHLLQTNQLAMTYLGEVAAWLRAHPTEVIVMWLSKHGDPCSTGEEQYPEVTVEEKRAFWAEIVGAFGDLLIDSSMVRINETSVGDLVKRSARWQIYAADWAEFTNASPLALDSCLIQNMLGSDVAELSTSLAWQEATLQASAEGKRAAKATRGFTLMSMAGSPPSAQMLDAAQIRFLGGGADVVASCAASFNLPSFNWCPQTLLDVAQLSNYWWQLSLEKAYANGWGFPHAIYINSVDWEGVVRTGTQLPWGRDRSPDAAHATTGYAYAATVVAHNLRLACGGDGGGDPALCIKLGEKLDARRAANPLTVWDEPALGRRSLAPIKL